MNGETDALYRKSRGTILQVLRALEAHRDAITLVGAHALYQYTGASELGIVEFTSDADFSISAEILAEEPHLEDVLLSNGFTRLHDVGRWRSPTGIAVDFMVPRQLLDRRGNQLLEVLTSKVMAGPLPAEPRVSRVRSLTEIG